MKKIIIIVNNENEEVERIEKIVERDFENYEDEILRDLESIKKYGVIISKEFCIFDLNDLIGWCSSDFSEIENYELYEKLMKEKLKKVCKEKLKFDLNIENLFEINEDNYKEVKKYEEILKNENMNLEKLKKIFKK